MKKYENVFKALFIAATIFFLVIFIGVFLAVGLTGAYEELSQDDKIAMIVVGFVVLFVIVLFAIIGVLIFKDAKKLGMNAWMWTLIAIYAPNGIGIIVYLIFRYNEKKNKHCPSCNYVLKGDYDACPSCGQVIGSKCEECGKPIDSDWKVCPYCRHLLRE